MSLRPFSNLSEVVYKRTYSRSDTGYPENFLDTVERVIAGNVEGHGVKPEEIDRLRYFLQNRKAGPAGRGWWCSGSPAQKRFGGASMTNCWFLTADDWMNFVIAQDLLMLGGGVGLSVERQFSDKLPKVKKSVVIQHKFTKDADFIVPDSREGWCELTRRVLESFFVTGKGFSYSTVVIRPGGEPIKGFGGTSSGPKPLVRMIEKICGIFLSREGHKLRPIDASDVLCCIGEMVVAGNVRRSALLILGDAHDREYLKAKRWDLGPVPTQRAMANFSIVAEDAENDLRPLFWETYSHGEAFGIVNRHAMQHFGRMGEKKKDTALGVNPCGEATLEDGEPCNLSELNLAALESPEEFEEAARLMHRWSKRVTMEKYHWDKCQEVITRNRRVGTGITGCLESPLFVPEHLNRAYAAIQEENISYAKELGINPSIRTTVVKPSGSMSKMMGAFSEGIHPAYSRYFIQRIRVASNDPLIPRLQAAGHYMEPVERFDGTLDPDTQVVDFYLKAPDSCPVADEGFDTWKQLEALKMAQKHWADQAVSVTAYYDLENLPKIKEWITSNLDEIKSVSFLRHQGHGFKQAPKEPISASEYDRLQSKVKPLDTAGVGDGDNISGIECEGGFCPVR
jgi:ribonucleoside-triphosphate reductase